MCRLTIHTEMPDGSESSRRKRVGTPQEFFAADERVCVLGHYEWKIRRTGRSSERLGAWFTLRNGKVVRFREFNDTAQFAEACRG